MESSCPVCLKETCTCSWKGEIKFFHPENEYNQIMIELEQIKQRLTKIEKRLKHNPS